MAIFSFIVYFSRKFFSRFRESQRCSRAMKSIYWIVDKLYRMFIFGYFIRNALEMSQYILISSFNEIYYTNTTNSYRIISLSFSLLIILIFVVMIGIVLFLILSSYSLNENEHNKLEEIFRGLQQDKKSRFYVIILLLRRFTFIILIITCVSISSRILVIILSVIQIIYAIFLTFIRPYEETRGNIIEILNEIYFSFLTIFLIAVNTENEWSSSKTNLYIWVIASNTFVIFTIVLVCFLKSNCTWICSKCLKYKRSRENKIRDIQRQNQTTVIENGDHVRNGRDCSICGSQYRVNESRVDVTISNVNLNMP